MPQDAPLKPCCTGPENAFGGTLKSVQSEYLAAAQHVAVASPDLQKNLRSELVEIPGGLFDMGARKARFPDDLDSPRRKIRLSPFRIGATTVTNVQYARFVEATGYQTVAEREGWSFVFHLMLPDATRFPSHPPGLTWWRQVEGACWSAPEGPGSSTAERPDHPAVHIAWYDALAYCNWAGLRLPREAEWERAARGGHAHRKFPWGNALMGPDGHLMNTFQGEFPNRDTGEDGWIGTAPANAYAPNDFGLYNMTGNVWEWVSDFYGPRPRKQRLPETDPTGPSDGFARIQRGGSYLCHVSYCDRYHVHSRTQNDPDSSTGNAGFRVCADG